MSRAINGLRVTVKEWDNIDKSLRKLKNMVKENGNLKIVQEKEYYEQPSLVRKREKAIGRARHLKKLRKQALPKRP